MTYEEGILSIPKQFEYLPEIIGKEKIRPFKRVIVLGMGGSRLGADVLNMVRPETDIYVHSDFDLPKLGAAALGEALIIANSYSGDTAETVSGAKMAHEQGLNLAIISGDGKLQDMAVSEDIPHIKVPHDQMPARMDVGYDLMAIVAMLGLDAKLFRSCADIDPLSFEAEGKKLAGQLRSAIPLIYTSNSFNELGYVWKIILNETAKVPAFQNRFPEIDHNEIAGFERHNPVAGLHAVMLKDSTDPRIAKRVDAVARLLMNRNVPVTVVPIPDGSLPVQVVSSMILAHWVSNELANFGGNDPLLTTIIEEFKKEIHD